MADRIRGFWLIAAEDKRLTMPHACIYISLCVLQAAGEGHNPFAASRRQVMRLSKISGIATYHKCIRELTRFGYIAYVPSYHPTLGSQVTLLEFSTLLNS